MSTNKKILTKGISCMSWALPALFIGPAVVHFAFINKQQPIYWLILSIGILVCLTGIVLVFMGINTIIKSLFDK
ncbi:DUF6095 family protein [Flavobacterium sp. PLA-1-15]|uniref:DUF6095 family protein n=1 Tax=Flavobacterium sp. PLA-1-15 TaxID=3380533 RepID=UPI003B7C8BFA